ncbi:MAG: (Fe-S)-binding protein [Candidatus Helarchaeota archaeon]
MSLDLLEKYAKIVYYCSHCRLCSIANYHELKDWKPICPSGEYFKFESYFSSGRMELIRGLIEGKLKNTTPETIKKIAFGCQVCGGCYVQCKDFTALGETQNQVHTFEDLRTAIVDMYGPLEKHKEMADDTTKDHNPYKVSNETRFDWLEGKKIPEGKKTVYFAGCTASFREPEIAKATVKLLEDLGIEFSILGSDEWCCSSPLLRTGQRSVAMPLIEHNYEVLKAKGIETIITSCAGCYQTLKNDYPKMLGKDLGIKIVHSCEIFDKKIKKGELKLNGKSIKITYHDPCHIARHANIRKAPRRVLNNIPKVVFEEFERHGKNAWCCGAGGGVRKAFPDFANWTAEQRILEADQIEGLEAIVSTCPFCKSNLKATVDRMGRKYKVIDLTELLLECQ